MISYLIYLEVMYIGQLYGVKGSRAALDIFKSHSS